MNVPLDTYANRHTLLIAQGDAVPDPSDTIGGTTQQQPGATGTGTGTGAGGGLGPIMWLLPLVLVMMIVMSAMSGRKEKKKREQMISAIGKKDRVQTIGGILGTVVEIKDNEVLLRVDESTNTKLTFSKSAIQQVVQKHGVPEPAGEQSDETKTPSAQSGAGV